jgi:hypothetical protein
LTNVDLLEISYTSNPVHPATRALGWRSMSPTTKRYLDPRTGRRMDYPELLAHTKAMADLMDRKSRPIRIASFEC